MSKNSKLMSEDLKVEIANYILSEKKNFIEENLIYVLTKLEKPSLLINCAIVTGTANKLDAKITGTTPAEFILIGI